jgi:hypothetical protein
MPWERKRIEIPDDFDPSERAELAQLIIEHIRDRTGNQMKGVKNGRNFDLRSKPYSESYIKSAAFKGAGKSKNRVNLRLSNEMLDAIKLISHKKGSVLIGFDKGSRANDKAAGNRLGSYGRSPNPSKARPFLDITEGDLNRIINEYF